MNRTSRRIFHLNPADWTWWAWLMTTALLIAGLCGGHGQAFIWSMALTAGQALVFLARDRTPAAFSVQLRAAYLILLLIAYPPPMRWLYWLPAVGTSALIVFGYCLMARVLSMLPFNSREAYTLARLRRTFLSPPDLKRVTNPAVASCVGGLCTIEAQVAQPTEPQPHHSRQPLTV